MKVHIIGIPSAGKTTLARGLSSVLSVPHHDLDSLAFVDERWTPRPAAERDAMVAQILEEPGFVTEGGFLGWTEPLVKAADVVFWLDPPLRVLISRHVGRHWRHTRHIPTLLRFQVLMYLRPAGAGPFDGDPDQTRAGIELALRPWGYKVVRLTRPVSAEDVIKHLPQPRPA